MSTASGLHGLMAEFAGPEELVAAARRAYAAGYRRMDAYSPFPVEGLSDAIGFRRTWVPWLVLGGGLIGVTAGFALQYWTSVFAYPLNVGGRPLVSLPAYVPVMFELMILLAAFAAVGGMLALNRLPEPYHPVFNVSRFARASQDGFFLCIEASDPRFDLQRTRRFLQELQPIEVYDVAD